MYDDLIDSIVLNEKGPNSIDRSTYGDFEYPSDVREFENNLYWRMTVDNKVGVLRDLTGVFSSYEVNIERVIAKEFD